MTHPIVLIPMLFKIGKNGRVSPGRLTCFDRKMRKYNEEKSLYNYYYYESLRIINDSLKIKSEIRHLSKIIPKINTKMYGLKLWQLAYLVFNIVSMAIFLSIGGYFVSVGNSTYLDEYLRNISTVGYCFIGISMANLIGLILIGGLYYYNLERKRQIREKSPKITTIQPI